MPYDLEITLGMESREKIRIGDTLELNVVDEEEGMVLRKYEVKKLRALQDGIKIHADQAEEA